MSGVGPNEMRIRSGLYQRYLLSRLRMETNDTYSNASGFLENNARSADRPKNKLEKHHCTFTTFPCTQYRQQYEHRAHK